MRFVFRREVPPFDRVLLVESGSRDILEKFLPVLYERYGERMRLDVLTCYAGPPAEFRHDQGCVYYVQDFPRGESRAGLFRELKKNGYGVLGMICSAEQIMTKWKWAAAFRLPAKVLIVNENADCFWLDWSHWRHIQGFVLFRAGLSGGDAARTVVRLAVFPFMLVYLLLYAAAVHLRRKVRT